MVKMSKVRMVRALVEQRLTAAAEEIFGLFERTIAEYEEELCRSKEENERQQKLLDAVWKPEVRIHRAEGIPSKQQVWSPSLDQEDPAEPPHIKEVQEDPPQPQHIKEEQEEPPEPPHIKEEQEDPTEPLHIKEEQEDPTEPLHIKEEQEELWTSQAGEQHQGLEEADTTKLLFTPVPVKSEDDGEKPQSSQLHQRQTEQMETGADGEDWGGPQPDRNLGPDIHLQSETEDSDDDWTKSSKDVQQQPMIKGVPPEQHEWSPSLDQQGPPQPVTINEEQEELWTGHEREQLQWLGQAGITKFLFTPVSIKSGDGEEKPRSSQLHQKQTEQMEKGADGEDFGGQEEATDLVTDIPFSCSDCDKRFPCKEHVRGHAASHTEEKRFSCPCCGKRFNRKSSMTRHVVLHTGEKRFGCPVCHKRFHLSGQLTQHMDAHTGKKTISCPVCGKGFHLSGQLTQHMVVHTVEKRFSCSVCGKTFKRKGHVKAHMAIHTGEKRFSCSVCDQRFTWGDQLRKHKQVCPESSQLHQN